MGLSIERCDFAPSDYAQFSERLQEDLGALNCLLDAPAFGQGAPTIGAELEVHLVDERGLPKCCNREVLQELDNPSFALEINRFNLEFNAAPVELRGHPFATMKADLASALKRMSQAAERRQARIAVIGILPTLRLSDLGPNTLSDVPRFRGLSEALRKLRGEPFQVHIEGEDTLQVGVEDVSLEGANTSFQVHLRVPPSAFARHYNAAQLSAAPILAIAGNSPFFAERRLWEETRVALFKQAVDTRRSKERGAAGTDARVSFGRAWIQSARDPFVHSVQQHAPLLPLVHGPSPAEYLQRNQIPPLEALRLHHGTVWTWNRAIFDPSAGGHLRIEHRALPAGPSLQDMVANAAFTLGLTLALASSMDEIARRFPFEHAVRNFYAAAKSGLAAEFSWPDDRGIRTRSAREVVFELLPRAGDALREAGVAPEDYEPLLRLLRARAETGRTGAQMQRALLAHYGKRMPRHDAFAATLEAYLNHSNADRAVHTWRMPGTLSFRSPHARAEN